jgi:hypothetical protein
VGLLGLQTAAGRWVSRQAVNSRSTPTSREAIDDDADFNKNRRGEIVHHMKETKIIENQIIEKTNKYLGPASRNNQQSITKHNISDPRFPAPSCDSTSTSRRPSTLAKSQAPTWVRIQQSPGMFTPLRRPRVSIRVTRLRLPTNISPSQHIARFHRRIWRR